MSSDKENDCRRSVKINQIAIDECQIETGYLLADTFLLIDEFADEFSEQFGIVIASDECCQCTDGAASDQLLDLADEKALIRVVHRLQMAHKARIVVRLPVADQCSCNRYTGG